MIAGIFVDVKIISQINPMFSFTFTSWLWGEKFDLIGAPAMIMYLVTLLKDQAALYL